MSVIEVSCGNNCGNERVDRGIWRTRYGWRFYVRLNGTLLTKRIGDQSHALPVEELILRRGAWRASIGGRRRGGTAPVLSAKEVAGLLAKLPERFRRKVQTSRGCWTWLGSLAKGYGRYYQDGRMRQAHVVAYQMCIGPIAVGTELDHICRVRHCVNPRHVEPVPHRVNVLRGDSPAAWSARIGYCTEGHKLVFDGRQRRCPTCQPTGIGKVPVLYRLCACGCGNPLLPHLIAKPNAKYLPFHNAVKSQKRTA